MKNRLDVFLTEQNLVRSRNVAKDLIINKKVSVNNKIIDKPNYLVNDTDNVFIIENEKYVSRAAYKLLAAIENFNLDLNNKNVIDIGSSTGGFSQVLLENKINHLYCIDVGTDQLDQSIRSKENVTVYENTNFKDVTPNMFFYDINFITIDVSFTSIQPILLKIKNFFKQNIKIVALLKPQFELGKQIIKNKGFVKPKEQLKIIEDFKYFCSLNNFKILNYINSPILGAKKNNQEFLFYLELVNDK